MQGNGVAVDAANAVDTARGRVVRRADLVIGAGLPAFVGAALLSDSAATWWSRLIIAPVAFALAWIAARDLRHHA